MIEGYLFDLKGKQMWKALGERVLFILSDYRVYLIIAGIVIICIQLSLITQQVELMKIQESFLRGLK